MTPKAITTRHHPLVKAVAHALRHRCGLRPSDDLNMKMVVGTSGGADSVALVRALHLLSEARGWGMKLVVGHVQHGLRVDAEDDAAFVWSLAQRLGLAWERVDLDLSKLPGNVEAQARRLRYEALVDLAQRCGATYIATAHHGDDQLETVLMRLLRGTSIQGLGGMAWRRPVMPGVNTVLIRPMLGVNRNLVIEFLRNLEQPWCEDHTNRDVSRLRARLRRDVVPVLRELRADVSWRSVELGEHLRDVAGLMDTAIDRAVKQSVRWSRQGWGSEKNSRD